MCCMICGRRAALHVLGCATLVGCSGDTTSGAGTDASSEPSPCAGLGTRVGAITDFPAGTWTLHGSIVVAQDEGGLYAFTAICTHQGCVVGPPSSDGTMICPCHGSEFDGDGNVLVGPATAPLEHFAVTTCGGDVYVNTKKSVAASTRTPARASRPSPQASNRTPRTGRAPRRRPC